MVILYVLAIAGIHGWFMYMQSNEGPNVDVYEAHLGVIKMFGSNHNKGNKVADEKALLWIFLLYVPVFNFLLIQIIGRYVLTSVLYPY